MVAIYARDILYHVRISTVSVNAILSPRCVKCSFYDLRANFWSLSRCLIEWARINRTFRASCLNSQRQIGGFKFAGMRFISVASNGAEDTHRVIWANYVNAQWITEAYSWRWKPFATDDGKGKVFPIEWTTLRRKISRDEGEPLLSEFDAEYLFYPRAR